MRHQEQKIKFPDIADCLNTYDFEAVAQRRMKPQHLAYYATGATDNYTKFGNQEVFRKIELVPRVMINVASPVMATTMLGYHTSAPIYISGCAKGGLADKEGELALSRAAFAEDVIQMAPHFATRTLEEIAASAQGEQVHFLQIYVEKDRAKTAELVKRAEALGYKGLFITVDSAGVSKNESDLRLTPGGNTTTAATTAAKRRWADDLTWDDVAWFRSLTSMKLVLKGVQSSDDALLAHQHGLDGIVCSNHGGRRQDTSRPTLKVLAEVVKALRAIDYDEFDARPFEVFIDGGVQRGSDVFKALALGATGVGLGRAPLMGLAAYGQPGVERVLQILKEELLTTMQYMGTTTLAQVRSARLTGLEQALQASSFPSGGREQYTSALRFPES